MQLFPWHAATSQLALRRPCEQLDNGWRLSSKESLLCASFENYREGSAQNRPLWSECGFAGAASRLSGLRIAAKPRHICRPMVDIARTTAVGNETTRMLDVFALPTWQIRG
jgi:hypothetical protein